MAIEDDKIVHSAVGLGSILTAVLGLVFWIIGLPYLVVLSPVVLAVGKEVCDYFKYGKPDKKDLFATLNPAIIINWYREKLKS